MVAGIVCSVLHFRDKVKMRKSYLSLIIFLCLIPCAVAFADNIPRWSPDLAAENVEEPVWIFFGVIALAVIAIGRGIYRIRKRVKKTRS